ncbi:hypothetical protein KSD_23660 [Ktedonobacter sp. SOSP1-85]|nr:hypothetical protein KSD_23660 [Ktedonobacter sp. SOSP1-85]
MGVSCFDFNIRFIHLLLNHVVKCIAIVRLDLLGSHLLKDLDPSPREDGPPFRLGAPLRT